MQRPEPAGAAALSAIGDLQGEAYERNAFAQGTAAETEALWTRLDLAEGDRVLDVGAATGRHSRALAARGCLPVALDLSHAVLTAGARQARREGLGIDWVRADAGLLPLARGSVDAAISVCQGAFGLGGDADRALLAELARVVRPGGGLALTAYSLAFAARFLGPEDALDLPRGLLHAPAEVRDRDGRPHQLDHWSACYSPAHLCDLLAEAGFTAVGLWGWEPGAPTDRPPVLTDPEVLVSAVRDP